MCVEVMTLNCLASGRCAYRTAMNKQLQNAEKALAFADIYYRKLSYGALGRNSLLVRAYIKLVTVGIIIIILYIVGINMHSS